MKDKIKLVLKVIQNVIEELWTVAVLIWDLPVALIEMIWLSIFDKEKFQYNWNLLKSSIREGRTE